MRIIGFIPLFLIISLNGISQIELDYSIEIDFEMNSDLIIFDTAQTDTLWQIGKPSKIYLNNAFSGNKAILTDTLNDYPVNTISSFIVRILPKYIGSESILSFQHKFDIDNDQDSGYIEASYNGGLSWEPMKDVWNSEENFFIKSSWHSIDSDGIVTTDDLKIVGKSNGWVNSTFTWIWFFPVNIESVGNDSVSKPIVSYMNDFLPWDDDTLLIRFSLYSDSLISQHEGWMIDNILIGGHTGGGAIKNYNANNTLMSIAPNPLRDIAYIEIKQPIPIHKYIIYDSQGHEILSAPMKDLSFPINTSNLVNGVYFLRVVGDDNKSLVQKFIKQ